MPWESTDYEDFHAWSVRDRPAFWAHTLKQLGIVFTRPPDAMLDLAGGVRRPQWLPGAELNIVDSCFTTDPNRPAVITPSSDGSTLSVTTYGELERLVNRLANGLVDRGLAPDKAIALYMPLSLECVTAYLAIIRAGSRVVSIADSFPAGEVRSRMAIAGADCVVTMDHIVRGGKTIPLYDTVVEAGASTVIVVPTGDRASPPTSRRRHLLARSFLQRQHLRIRDRRPQPHDQHPVLLGDHRRAEGHTLDAPDAHQKRHGRSLSPGHPLWTT